ncbi:MAG: PKD domain-containing protein [bacterium]|nr:PKD domain-containing protein [bacterium]
MKNTFFNYKTGTMKYNKLSFGALFIFGLLSINNAMAQGPVQPEAMQFEPVDVTDVVNLATGDFVYTIPIMNVPGPAGDYPIVLSYHSGIGPNQPATWVGLGWTLNPGAVNRTLSGYPDDYNGDQVVTHHQGENSSWAIQVGGGWGPIGLNMNYNHESGKVGINAMVGISLPNNIGNLSASYGTDGFSANGSAGYSNMIGSVGISAGTNGVSINKSVNDIKKLIPVYGQVSAATSLIDQLNGGNFQIGGVGFSSVSSSSPGKGKTTMSGFSTGRIPLPGNAWINFGFSKWKWKLDETTSEKAYGSLYKFYGTNYNNVNERQLVNNVLVPSKDAFNVSTQGLSGVFTSVDEYVYRLNDYKEVNRKGIINSVTDWDGNAELNNEPKFRFLGDQGYNFVNRSTKENFGDNYEPLDLDEYSGKKIVPTFSSTGKIIGFTITKTDGMTYEFNRPINTYYQFSKTWSNESNNYENWSSLGGEFANTWLLTAVKGPDYVDRGSAGISDDDWGYWVKFSYAKEPELQLWRAPYEGRAAVGDESAEQVSFGINEKYYLQEIETKTHRAEFTSSLSKNGRPPNDDVFSESNVFGALFQPKVRSESPVYSFQGYFEFKYEGDYRWVNTLPYTTQIFRLSNFVRDHGDNSDPSCTDTYISSTYVTVNSYNESTNESLVRVNFNNVCSSNYSVDGTFQLQNTIEDHTDNTSRDKKLDRVQLVQKESGQVLNAVEFDYDYTLRGNSNGSSAGNDNGTINGALTLRKVEFKGLNNTTTSPPYRFDYPTGLYNPDYHVDDIDQWGSYRYNDNDRGPRVRTTHREQSKANYVKAWNLNKITTPTGSSIDIEYESDDFFFLNGTVNLQYASELPISGSWNNQDTHIQITNWPSDMPTGEHSVFLLHRFWWKMEGIPPPYSSCSLFDPNQNYLQETEGSSLFFLHRLDVSNRNNGTLYLENPIDFYRLTDCYYADSKYFIDIRNTYELVYSPAATYGGGSRVKAVSTNDGTVKLKTIYTYKDGGLSSGTTPSISNPTDDPIVADGITSKPDDYTSIYLESEKSFNRPSPSVIYSKVQVLNVDQSDDPISGMTEFEFYTSKDHPHQSVVYQASVTSIPNLIQGKDYSGIYGMPKATTYYEQIEIDGEVAFRPVSKTASEYVFSTNLNSRANIIRKGHNNENGELGIVQEKHISSVETNHQTFIAELDLQKLNVFNVGQSSIEYFYDSPNSLIPASIFETIGKTVGFDMHTGQPLISVSQTENVNESIISRVTPAWWKYSDMYSKNMLTQTFESASYRAPINISNVGGLKNYAFSSTDLLSSTITTWKNWGNDVWRKNDTYELIPKFGFNSFEPTNDLNYSGNNYTIADVSNPWEMTSNIVQYDHYGHVIESVNKDGSFNSVIMDATNNSLVLAVASNAKLNEVVYDGFNTLGNAANARTGTGFGEYVDGNIVTAPSNPPSHGGKYKVNFWYKSQDPNYANGVSIPQSDDQWKFAQLLLNPGESLSTIDKIDIDDVTIIPEYASISYFAYDPLTWKVTAMTGPDHRTTFYEYDEAGRLIYTKDFEGNILSKNEYGFADNHYLTVNNKNPEVNETVYFTPVTLNSNGTIETYIWDFGDGNSIESTNLSTVSNTFSSVGVYPVSLLTVDNNGNNQKSIIELKVIPENNSINWITLSFSQSQVGSNSRLITLYAEHDGEAIDYKWYYKGTSSSIYNLVNGSGYSGTSPSFTVQPGTYHFKVEATDPNNSTTSTVISATIY